MRQESGMGEPTLINSPEKGNTISSQLRGETMAYAVQNVAYSLAANLYEPYINYRVRRYYSDHSSTHPGHGNYTQNLVGEFAGDLIGAGTLMVAETLIPKQLHSFTRAFRKWVDPIFDKAARFFHAKDCSAPDFEEKIERWKTFQERNFVRSTIMTTAGIAGNIATQKWVVGNTAPMGVILAGKVASSAVTMALELGARLAFPNQLNKLDNWMGARISPMFADKEIVEAPKPENSAAPTHAAKLLSQQAATTQTLSR
jgi:hypothetical protein